MLNWSREASEQRHIWHVHACKVGKFIDKPSATQLLMGNPSDSILKLDVMKARNVVSGHSIKAAIKELPGSRKERLMQYFNLL